MSQHHTSPSYKRLVHTPHSDSRSSLSSLSSAYSTYSSTKSSLPSPSPVLLNKRLTKESTAHSSLSSHNMCAQQLHALFLDTRALRDAELDKEVRVLRDAVLAASQHTQTHSDTQNERNTANTSTNNNNNSNNKSNNSALRALFRNIDSDDHSEIKAFAAFLAAHTSPSHAHTHAHAHSQSLSTQEKVRAETLYRAILSLAATLRRKRVSLSLSDATACVLQQYAGFKDLFSTDYFALEAADEEKALRRQRERLRESERESLRAQREKLSESMRGEEDKAIHNGVIIHMSSHKDTHTNTLTSPHSHKSSKSEREKEKERKNKLNNFNYNYYHCMNSIATTNRNNNNSDNSKGDNTCKSKSKKSEKPHTLHALTVRGSPASAVSSCSSLCSSSSASLASSGTSASLAHIRPKEIEMDRVLQSLSLPASSPHSLSHARSLPPLRSSPKTMHKTFASEEKEKDEWLDSPRASFFPQISHPPLTPLSPPPLKLRLR